VCDARYLWAATAPAESADQPLLVFTDSAARKVSELITEEVMNLKLRVFVSVAAARFNTATLTRTRKTATPVS
jgi:Fe-S cluster assembly iron-binding protein IscA